MPHNSKPVSPWQAKKLEDSNITKSDMFVHVAFNYQYSQNTTPLGVSEGVGVQPMVFRVRRALDHPDSPW